MLGHPTQSEKRTREAEAAQTMTMTMMRAAARGALRVARRAVRRAAPRSRVLRGGAAVAASAAAVAEGVSPSGSDDDSGAATQSDEAEGGGGLSPPRPDVNAAEIMLYGRLNDLCAVQLGRLPVPASVTKTEREFDKEHFYPDGCADCTKMLVEGPCGGLFLRMLWCADAMYKSLDEEGAGGPSDKAKEQHKRCQKVFEGVSDCLARFKQYYPQEHDAIANPDGGPPRQ